VRPSGRKAQTYLQWLPVHVKHDVQMLHGQNKGKQKKHKLTENTGGNLEILMKQGKNL